MESFEKTSRTSSSIAGEIRELLALFNPNKIRFEGTISSKSSGEKGIASTERMLRFTEVIKIYSS